ncbi:cbb3-type cytochrome oxidase assembly protein CcoS [Pseudomonas oligotrophica]|uniref:cbb3-type cytochrome oxidase assembly protein CcoS n=1 Tax=Pseudomonas oligotrophica TaxID=2912055 RepID=UPI001F0286BF|nr:cbb3-type cytochrome oxidase assembly protein CcoS [Pseudomonas oligotrophica]MCF7203410.1 cbb3-type cytochrome oxidase assembly protein CcoS [Pseudomonas oligotrophica]
MAALYVLIPVAVVLVALAIWVFFWAVDSGQFDDLDSPAHSILFDDDEALPKAEAKAPEETDRRNDD